MERENRYIVFAIGVLILAGCEDKSLQPMTNEEIIQQVKLCERAGMKPQLLVSTWDSRVVIVQCVPKD